MASRRWRSRSTTPVMYATRSRWRRVDDLPSYRRSLRLVESDDLSAGVAQRAVHALCNDFGHVLGGHRFFFGVLSFRQNLAEHSGFNRAQRQRMNADLVRFPFARQGEGEEIDAGFGGAIGA